MERAGDTYDLLQNGPWLQLALEQTPRRSGLELWSGMGQRLVCRRQCIWIHWPPPPRSIRHHHLSDASSLCTGGRAHSIQNHSRAMEKTSNRMTGQPFTGIANPVPRAKKTNTKPRECKLLNTHIFRDLFSVFTWDEILSLLRTKVVKGDPKVVNNT